jgi:hypothetical protein
MTRHVESHIEISSIGDDPLSLQAYTGIYHPRP